MKKKIKKEVIEWVVLLSIFGIIYIGGWHTEVIGRLQQVVLSTGIISPSSSDDEATASYDFTLEDVEGNLIDFDSFKGKVVFLNFWATWCPPCIAEMPDIHSLYEERDDVNFVMISLDRDPQKAKDFVLKKEFDFPIYFLRSSIPGEYSIQSIPTTYLIDKQGKIHIENHGMAKYNTSRINDLLDQLSMAE